MIDGSWAVAGRGNIGGELMRTIATTPDLGLNPSPDFVITSEGVMTNDLAHKYGVADIRDIPPDLMPGVLFLANPTTADGQPAMLYAEHALRSGRNVVTAEKGAASKNYPKLARLSDGFRRLGISATVGGGSLIMPRGAELLMQHEGNVSSIVGVVNGTVQATLGEASATYGSGMAPEASIAWAQAQGFAEPGDAEPFDVLRGEIDGDVPMKMLILARHVLGMTNIAAVDFRTQTSDDVIRRAFAEDRRYVIAFARLANGGDYPDDDLIGGMSLEHQGWNIRSGFMRIGSTAVSKLLTETGPANGLTFSYGPFGVDGTETISGPGAGAKPTVNAMLYDYRTLFEAELDPTLTDRTRGYKGGKPRRILTEAERAEFLAKQHAENVEIMEAAGLKLVFSEMWVPGFSGALDEYLTLRAKLVARYGEDNVLNGPGSLQSVEGELNSMGIWIPEGDGSKWRRRSPDLYLNNGKWSLQGGPDPDPPRAKLLSIFN